MPVQPEISVSAPAMADIAPVVGMLLPRLLGRAADDGRGQVENLDGGGIAAIKRSAAADIGDIASRHRLARRRHEHAFGVARSEIPPLAGRSGLEQHRRALRRRFAQMNRIELEDIRRRAGCDGPSPDR